MTTPTPTPTPAPHILRVKLLHPDATPPTQSHPGSDLGWDLSTPAAVGCPPGVVTPIPTGIALGFPPGVGGLICGRSGLAKGGLWPVGGCIDPGYVGPIIVLLFNSTSGPVTFLPGNRVGQLVLVPLIPAAVREVATLGETDRGDRGFGSSGT